MSEAAESAVRLAMAKLAERGLRGVHHFDQLKEAADGADEGDEIAVVDRECERIIELDRFDAVIGF